MVRGGARARGGALEPQAGRTPRPGALREAGGSRPEPWHCHLGLREGPASLTRLAAPPPVFVLEYYLDTLWKGTLLFAVCLLLISFGLVSQV